VHFGVPTPSAKDGWIGWEASRAKSLVKPSACIHPSIHPQPFYLFPRSTSSNFSPFCSEDGSKGRAYGHALVVGIEAAPLAVSKSMSQKRIAKRSHIKPFVKVINFNHMMVTRYAVEGLDFKNMLASLDDLKEPSKKKEMKKSIRKMLEERYASGQNRWFFQKLRF
jgi:large subunit ribosomal protein L27e